MSEIFLVSHFGKDFIRAGSDHFLPLSVWKTVKCSLANFFCKGGMRVPPKSAKCFLPKIFTNGGICLALFLTKSTDVSSIREVRMRNPSGRC